MSKIRTIRSGRTLEEYTERLHEYVGSMNEYQAELVLAFIETLFGLNDYDDAAEARKAA